MFNTLVRIILFRIIYSIAADVTNISPRGKKYNCNAVNRVTFKLRYNFGDSQNYDFFTHIK